MPPEAFKPCYGRGMARPKTPKKTAKKPTRPSQGLPDRDTLLAYIREQGEPNKAGIASAFGLKGADRRALREMLTALEAEGALGKRGRRGFAEAGAFPEVGVVDVVGKDTDGELLVKLVKGEETPVVTLAPGKEAGTGAPGMGDRLLVRFNQLETGEFQAKLIKRLGQSAHRILGVVRKVRRECGELNQTCW